MDIDKRTTHNPYWRIAASDWPTQPDSNLPIPWTGYPLDDQETLMAPYSPNCSLRRKRMHWHCLWHTAPLALVCHLRTKYKLNLKAFLRAYSPSDEDSMRDEESSFRYFVNLKRRLLRRATQDALKRRGEAAARSFMEAVVSDGVVTEENDFVFVSIDFEGQHGQRTGIKEFGLAKLDARSCLKPTAAGKPDNVNAIQCFSYGRTHSASRQFQYGTTTQMEVERLDELTAQSLTIRDEHQDHKVARSRKIILVGQSVHNELFNLEQLGLDISQLGVVGTLDTWDMARSTFSSRSLDLRQIMDLLEMPQRENS